MINCLPPPTETSEVRHVWDDEARDGEGGTKFEFKLGLRWRWRP